MDLARIRDEIATWEDSFIKSLGSSECRCGGCLHALSELAKRHRALLELLAEHLQTLLGLTNSAVEIGGMNSAAVLALQRADVGAAVTRLEQRMDTLEDLIRPLVVGEGSVGALALRVAALEQCAHD